jgi:hypothetical protein
MLERLTKANAPAGLPESFQLAWVTIKESESVKFVRYDSSRGEKTAGIYIERLDDWDDLKRTSQGGFWRRLVVARTWLWTLRTP